MFWFVINFNFINVIILVFLINVLLLCIFVVVFLNLCVCFIKLCDLILIWGCIVGIIWFMFFVFVEL